MALYQRGDGSAEAASHLHPGIEPVLGHEPLIAVVEGELHVLERPQAQLLGIALQPRDNVSR